MAELFEVTVPNIIYHLQQIDASGEIHLSEATKKILVPSDKCSGEVVMYNLDVDDRLSEAFSSHNRR